MLKNFICVLFLVVFYFPIYSCFAQNEDEFVGTIPPNTKEIIAWQSSISEKGDTVTSKKKCWQYDKKGNLIDLEYEKAEKKYDNQNRLIYIEKHDDYPLFISYPSKNTTITTQQLSHFSATSATSNLASSYIKKQVSYNTKGYLIREEIYDSLYVQTPSPSVTTHTINHYVTVYKYDKNNNLIEKNIFDLPQLTTRESSKFTYNTYNQILTESTNSETENNYVSASATKYEYCNYLEKGQTKPKILKISRTEYSEYSTILYVDNYDYSQKNRVEVETNTIKTTLGNEDTPQEDKDMYQLIYKDKRLIRKKMFSMMEDNKNKEISYWIDYQYIFH